MDAVVQKEGYLLLNVRVQPKASRSEIIMEPDGRVKVALTAPPVEGAANKALAEFVAKLLGVPKSNVNVVRGQKSREKTLKLDGVDAADLDLVLARSRKES